MTWVIQFSSNQSLSRVWLFETTWTAARQPPYPSPTPKLAQTNVHWVDDAIQPSPPLSSPSLPTFNICQHQSLFQWVSSSHWVVKVLELQPQHHSFQWTPRTDFLSDGLVWSPCSPRDSSRVFSNTTVPRHQFGTQPSLWSSSLKDSYHLQKRFHPSQNEGQGVPDPWGVCSRSPQTE